MSINPSSPPPSPHRPLRSVSLLSLSLSLSLSSFNSSEDSFWRSSEASSRERNSSKMNRRDIQQNAGLLGGCEVVGGSVSVSVSISLSDRKGPVVCPKPRRVGFFSNNPTMSLRWHRRNPQAGLCDSKEGAELLDMILMKEGYGSEKSPREIPSSPPFFCGSPPSRVSNPLVRDAQFRDLKLSPLSTLQFASPSSASSPSSAHKGGCSRMKFGLKPAAVRVEGFDCLSRDHQSSGITAVA